MYKRRWHLRSLVARPSRSPLSPYTTLFRSEVAEPPRAEEAEEDPDFPETDRHRGHLVHVDRGIDLQVPVNPDAEQRSEEHTSELQSQSNLVCRLLRENKNMNTRAVTIDTAV